jgi:hypothetical protein
MSADHAGYRIEWVGRDPVVVDPEGSKRPIGKAEQARMRRARIRAEAIVTAPKVGRVRRTIESITGEAPEPIPTAEPTPGGRPSVVQPSIRVTPEYRRESMRETVAEAFTLDMLATILRDLSIGISEADGAGEEGYLSRIQAVQLANLLYDVTVDVIVRRFEGNVGRFKMALAAILILVTKGRVHARAIAGKVERRNAESGGKRTAERIIAEAEADRIIAEIEGDDPIAILAARQRATIAAEAATSRRMAGGA